MRKCFGWRAQPKDIEAGSSHQVSCVWGPDSGRSLLAFIFSKNLTLWLRYLFHVLQSCASWNLDLICPLFMNSSSFQVSNLMHANWNTRQAMVSWNPTVALDIGSQKKVKHFISINIKVLQRNRAISYCCCSSKGELFFADDGRPCSQILKAFPAVYLWGPAKVCK